MRIDELVTAARNAQRTRSFSIKRECKVARKDGKFATFQRNWPGAGTEYGDGLAAEPKRGLWRVQHVQQQVVRHGLTVPTPPASCQLLPSSFEGSGLTKHASQLGRVSQFGVVEDSDRTHMLPSVKLPNAVSYFQAASWSSMRLPAGIGPDEIGLPVGGGGGGGAAWHRVSYQ